MVALGPGKFYGSSLPRPRFYTDVKYNDERVDSPPSVMDPLMSWAEEAHLSMGGLNSKRNRFQGRIEGNIERLRAQRENISKKSPKHLKFSPASPVSPPDMDNKSSRLCETPSPQPPPLLIKRRRVVGLVNGDEDAVAMKMKGLARKLGDVFDMVARESGMDDKISSGGESESDGAVAARTRGKKNEARLASVEGKINKRMRLVKGGRNVGSAVVVAAIGNRSSPRLAKSSGMR